MKKLFLSLVLFIFLAAGGANAATYYVSSSAAAGGDGSLSTPWNTIADINGVTFSAGDVINFAGTFTSETLDMDQSGLVGSYITMQQWGGESAWKLDGNNTNTYGVLLEEDYVKLKDVEIYNYTGGGVYCRPWGGIIPDHIELDNIYSHNNGGCGINFTSSNLTSPMTDLLVKNSMCNNNGAYGISYKGNINGLTITNCIVDGNGTASPVWGIGGSGEYSRTPETIWTDQGGNVYSCTKSMAVIDCIQSNFDSFRNLINGGDATPTDGQYWYDDTNDLLYVNIGENPTNKVTWCYAWAQNINICDSTVTNQNSYNGNEGNGIGLDEFTKDSGIYRCLSHNNDGVGFVVHFSKNCSIENNIAYSNIGIHGNYCFTGATAATAYNNVSYNATHEGFQACNISTITARNNIAFSNGAAGIDQETGSTITASHNCSYGNTVANWEGVSKGTGAIELDPLFRNAARYKFTLKSGSPCLNAGTDVSLIRDFNNWLIVGTPSMGAYQYMQDKYQKNIGSRVAVNIKTATGMLAIAESGIIDVDCTDGAISLYLPPFADCKGLSFLFSRIDTTVNTLTVLPSDSGGTIDGAANKTLDGQYNKLEVFSGTSEWQEKIIGSGSITSVGDCTSGAALDGTSDGGTYIKLYDGDSNAYTFDVPDITADFTFMFPPTLGTSGAILQRNATGGTEWVTSLDVTFTGFTPNRVTYSDGLGNLESSDVTQTELELLDGKTGILVTDTTECTDLEGTGLSIVAGVLTASAGASGTKEAAWVIHDCDVDIAVADGKQAFPIPASWVAAGLLLTDVTITIDDLNSAASGETAVIIRRVRGNTPQDMTSTAVTAGYAEYTASDGVVDLGYDDIELGDKIYVDVVGVTSPVQKGLSAILTFEAP